MKKKEITKDMALSKLCISIKDFARLVSMSEISVYRKVSNSELDVVYIGSRKMIPYRVYAPFIIEEGAE